MPLVVVPTGDTDLSPLIFLHCCFFVTDLFDRHLRDGNEHGIHDVLHQAARFEAATTAAAATKGTPGNSRDFFAVWALFGWALFGALCWGSVLGLCFGASVDLFCFFCGQQQRVGWVG